VRWPLITKSGTNQTGKAIHYYFNYSAQPQTFRYPYKRGTSLIDGGKVMQGASVNLPAWGFVIVEEE
jgi:beta-galactosidase